MDEKQSRGDRLMFWLLDHAVWVFLAVMLGIGLLCWAAVREQRTAEYVAEWHARYCASDAGRADIRCTGAWVGR